MSKPRIVIAGGGMAGHKLAYAFQNEAEVVLIDPKGFLEVPMAVPRLLVEPHALRALLTYDEFLPCTRRVEGMLTLVAPDHIVATAKDGATEAIPYDYLVLATGANYRSDLVKPVDPITQEARWQHFEKVRDLIAGANSIMIVGGGAIGVETAGEIVESFPGAKVTIVHSGAEILPVTTPKARLWARQFLEARGVRFVLGERLIGDAPDGDIDAAGGEAKTEKGTLIPYDLALWCTGMRPDASYMKPHFPYVLNGKGEVEVEPSLLVKGTRNIVALGDVADFPEKGASWARFQLPVAQANLRALIRDGDAAKLKPYKRSMPATMMILTLGRNNGICAMPFGTFRAAWMAKAMKAKTMFVPSYRKAVGLK